MGVTLHHGDCLDILPTLPDASVDMVLCDLPYGTTACKWDVVIPFAPLWEQYRRIVKRNGAIVLFGSQPFTSLLIASNLPMFRYEWVWEKVKATGHASCNKRPLKAHEAVLVFAYGQPRYNPQMTEGTPYKGRNNGPYYEHPAFAIGGRKTDNGGTRYPRSVLKVKDAYYSDGPQQHPTQKPVALCEYLIRTYTNEGEVVLDNTMGSGTTGVAAVNTGRAFIGIERDADYFDIAKRRIEAAQAAARQLTLDVA